MAIEYQWNYVDPKHRCTDCGAKWWPGSKPVWEKCPQPDLHPCPTCSAKPEPEPEVVACDAPEYHKDAETSRASWYRYCPRCGVALQAKQEE